MLADSLTKVGYPARATVELFLKRRQLWKAVHDEKFESQKRRTKKGFDRLISSGHQTEEFGEGEDHQVVAYQSGKENEKVAAYQSGDGQEGERPEDLIDKYTGLPQDHHQFLGRKNWDRAMSSLPWTDH